MTKTLIAIFLLLAFIATPKDEVAVQSTGLCPKTVAVLTPYLGDPVRTSSGQRVEIRQCPFNSEQGTMQIVAFEEGAASAPSLVIDTERRAVNQLVMIPGAYAFELLSSSATSVVGISFEGGKPRKVVEDSTKGNITIKSDLRQITLIELDDRRTPRKTHTIKGRIAR